MAIFELGNVQVDQLTEPSGGPASSFGDVVTAPGIDAYGATPFSIGTTNATAINIGHTGLSTYIYGNSLFIGGILDTITAGPLTLGGTNATSISFNSPVSFVEDLNPGTNDAYNVGSSSLKWHDGYFAGTITVPNITNQSGAFGITTNTGTITLGTGAGAALTMPYSGTLILDNPNGDLYLGTENPSSTVQLGRSNNVATNIYGGGSLNLQTNTGNINLGTGAGTAIQLVYSGVNTFDNPNGSISLGHASATAVGIGRTGITTEIYGALQVDGYASMNTIDAPTTLTLNVNSAPSVVFSQTGGNIEVEADGYRIFNANSSGDTYFGNTTGTTNINGSNIIATATTIYADGYLSIDGYATLSHDVGFTDTLALTQAANTTTGANLRLRKLTFFTDNIPTTQGTHYIKAMDGAQLSIGASGNVFFDSPQINWAQNASVYTGGFSLQVGTSTNYLKINPTIINTTGGIEYTLVTTGGSVGENIGAKLTHTISHNADAITDIVQKIIVVDNTDDAYSTGTVTGLYVDASGGSNTTKTRYAAKLSGGRTEIDGYLLQTSGAVSLTANATSQFTTTSGDLTVGVLGGGSVLNLRAPTGTINIGVNTATTVNIGNLSTQIVLNGHFITNGSTPGISAGPGAGTGGTASITGHDMDGYITVNTGTATPGSAVIATITFATAYPAAPRNILISPGNQAASDQSASSAAYTPVVGAVNGPTATTWTIVAGTGSLSDNTTYIWNYLVIG